MNKIRKIPRFNETAFIFPFSYGGGLNKWKEHFRTGQLDNYWTLSPAIDSKYFLSHILNKENQPLHYEYKPGSLKWNYTDIVTVKSTLAKDFVSDECLITLIGLSMFIFPTGMGFVVVRIKYDDTETIREIANLSAAFSRIFPNERDLVKAKIKCTVGEERLSLSHLLRDAVGQSVDNTVKFFPCTNGQRAFVFQRLSVAKLTETEKAALRRNLWVLSDNQKNYALSELEEELVLNDETVCMLSPMVMCVVSKNMRGTDEDIAYRENNIRFSYFNVFLLCIHEQQALMLYEQKIVSIGKKIGDSKKLKKDLLRFLPSYSFKVISLEITYQQIYLSLQKILHLETLEDRLDRNISMLETAYIQKRDTILNYILFILSLLGLVSLVGDIFTLINIFGG